MSVHEDVESWAGPASGPQEGLTPVVPAHINLLAPEPYSNRGSEAMMYRSTTYNPKEVSTAPFQIASVYTQDPYKYEPLNPLGFDMKDLSVTQMYTVGYRNYVAQHPQQQQLQGGAEEHAFSQLSTPPDFDGNAPTNAEAVAQHVRSLAKVYNSNPVVPTPFEMYQHLIYEGYRGYTATHPIPPTSPAVVNSTPAGAEEDARTSGSPLSQVASSSFAATTMTMTSTTQDGEMSFEEGTVRGGGSWEGGRCPTPVAMTTMRCITWMATRTRTVKRMCCLSTTNATPSRRRV